MKVLCGRDSLRDALAIVANALPSRTAKPALEAVLLDAAEQQLTLAVTDLEIAIRIVLQGVQVSAPGACLIPGREAADFVRDLTDDTITIEAAKNVARIFGKDDECELALADVAEFTGLPAMEEKTTFTIKASTLSALLQRTTFSVSKELGRFAMNGVRAEVSAERIRMIATDGRRLSLADGPVENGPAETVAVTIPTKASQQFLRALESIGDEMVSIAFAADRIALRTSNVIIMSRLLEGEFPRYQAVVPKEGKNVAECDTKQLAQKLRLVSHLCSSDQPVVRLKFTGSLLTVTSSSPQRGEARVEMPVNFMGTHEEIAFNPEFVLDGLKVSQRDTVRLEFNDRSSPGKFHLNENHEYVVMPVVNE